jgi:integrase
VVKAAAVDPKRFTPHKMRRTAITNLILAGVPLPTIQRISGHKTLIMLLRYFNLYGAHVHEAAANLEVEMSHDDSAVEEALLGTIAHELHTLKLEQLG